MFSIFKKQPPRQTVAMIPSPKKASDNNSGLPEYAKGLPSVEFLSKLAPPYNIRTFRKMRYNDAIIGGIMMEIELILASITWDIEGENSEFCEELLEHMESPIEQIIQEVASAITYGFYLGEKVFGTLGRTVYLRDVQPRFQESITAINNSDGNVIQDVSSGQYIYPYKKCLHHTFMADARNPFGTSLLRHVYQPYYFKTIINASEAATIDRDLSGLPVITTPEGFDYSAATPGSPTYDPAAEATLAWAANLVTSVRADSQQGVVLPYGFKLEIIRGENRSSIPTSDSINRYNSEIVSGLLSQFMMSTKMTDARTQIDTFLRTVDALALKIGRTLDQLLIDLCRMNGKSHAPKFKFAKTRQASLVDLASYIARLVTQGVITPTVELEESLLTIADLPKGSEPKPIRDKDLIPLAKTLSDKQEPDAPEEGDTNE